VITVPSSPPPVGVPLTSPPTTAIPQPPPPSVDAQFAFPSPTIAQAGYPLVLTTLVTRQSDRAPLPGWTVRYEVTNANASVGGPGNSRVEVPTDANGRASIEISPTSVGPGNAIVNMTVVQPPTLTAGATVAEVGRGSATITWREGVPGAPTWTPGAAMAASTFPSIPSDGSPTMPAPSLSGPSSSDTSSPDLTYGDSRQPNRFQPPPSLSKDSNSKTFAPPPKQEPAGKPEIVIELRRRGPAQVEVGGFASFEVIVTNRGEATARNIKLLDRFDAGLSHVRAVDNELAVKYEAMRDLAPGDSETVPLTFGVRAAGELCHEVTVTADGVAPVIDSGCVTAVAARPTSSPTLEVTKIAPIQHYVGENAKFRVVVKNTGEVEVKNLVITDEYDPALQPRYSSAGAEQLPDGRFQWKIASLLPAEKREFVVECQCVTPSVGACSRVNVTADGGLIYADEKCVDILPPANAAPKVGGVAPPPATSASKLQVTMRATANPARVGQPMGLFVYVKNNGTQPERGVSLRLLVPQEMTPDAAQIRPLGTAQVRDKEVNFGNIGDLQPGDEREFELVLSVDRPGNVNFRAAVSATGMTTPILSDSNQIQIEPAAL
jgi:uncharacterized repeat protein (TIGR01451 family)